MRVLVLGAGISGQGVALLMQQQGADVTLVNQKSFDTSMYDKVGIKCIFTDDASVNDGSYDFLIKAPGIPDRHPLVQSFDKVYNEIEWAYRYSNLYDYYCISGTNGKTTSTLMLESMLLKKDSKALLAGNVGIGLSQRVFEEGNFNRDVALEISGFQIDGLEKFHAKAYGLLNLSPDHLDHYETVEDYYNSKLKLVEKSDVFIRNIDDINIMKYNPKNKCTYDLSLNHEADISLQNDNVVFNGTVLFSKNDLNLVGKHNLYNASMAAAIAYIAGVQVEDIQNALREFKAVEHRSEFVATIDGVNYYNDSKATNPESVVVCLKSFESPVVLLAGGYDKHISFDILRDVKDRVKHAYLFGESKDQLAKIFDNVSLVETMGEAFRLASETVQSGDIVVLSPACASYDQFKSFEDRGNQFKALVNNMKI